MLGRVSSAVVRGMSGCRRGLQTSGNVFSNPRNRFAALPGGMEENCFLTYVWIDGSGKHFGSDTIRMYKEPGSLSELKLWGFDGSSIGQAVGHDSDMVLQPCAMVPDPFFPSPSKIVLCEVYDKSGVPSKTNHRAECAKVAAECAEVEPWFSFKQEYTMLGCDLSQYASIGAGRKAGRLLGRSHYLACLYAGLNVNGTKAEVGSGPWTYRLGPSIGIAVADELWLARFIMDRMGEEYGVAITHDPKPVEGDWNGTGNHCNFSTKAMREEGGLAAIKAAVEKLSKVHDPRNRDYDPNDGVDNRRRLTGLHETASIHEFSAAAGSRNVSVRIPRAVEKAGKGWRHSANCDPYKVVSRMLKTCVLDRE